MNSVNIAIIGFGYWGPNLVRNFNSIAQCHVHTVVDARQERLDAAKRMYPGISTTMQLDEVLEQDMIHAVIIATPVFTHFEIARKALESGKHVLIEKPMTSSAAEAKELIALAEKRKRVLMVDHTYLYTGAVGKIKMIIEEGGLGTIRYIDSTRINLGLFQPDINVLWDLAPHDISILNYLVAERPVSVNATGISHTNNFIENIAYLTLNYPSGFIAHFNCSWTSPVKIRNMLIGGDKKMIVFNDLEPTEKVKIYDTGYDYKTDEEKRRVLVDYRIGDVYIPQLNSSEALRMMAADFITCVLNETTPVSNAQLGLDVVRILEASSESIKNNGKEVFLNEKI